MELVKLLGPLILAFIMFSLGIGLSMENFNDKRDAKVRRKDIIIGILGGCGVILFCAGILAGAVLWRASWYFE